MIPGVCTYEALLSVLFIFATSPTTRAQYSLNTAAVRIPMRSASPDAWGRLTSVSIKRIAKRCLDPFQLFIRGRHEQRPHVAGAWAQKLGLRRQLLSLALIILNRRWFNFTSDHGTIKTGTIGFQQILRSWCTLQHCSRVRAKCDLWSSRVANFFRFYNQALLLRAFARRVYSVACHQKHCCSDCMSNTFQKSSHNISSQHLPST